MAELVVGQLIKIILGILVFVAVIIGVYLAFRNNFLDFFKNLGGNETAKVLLVLAHR